MTAFPLTAIVGQESLVEALLVNAVAPSIGGVLVRGERGTAKSTAVRALAPLLPPVRAAAGERFCFAPGEDGPDGPVPRDAAVVDGALGAQALDGGVDGVGGVLAPGEPLTNLRFGQLAPGEHLERVEISTHDR